MLQSVDVTCENLFANKTDSDKVKSGDIVNEFARNTSVYPGKGKDQEIVDQNDIDLEEGELINPQD